KNTRWTPICAKAHSQLPVVHGGARARDRKRRGLSVIPGIYVPDMGRPNRRGGKRSTITGPQQSGKQDHQRAGDDHSQHELEEWREGGHAEKNSFVIVGCSVAKARADLRLAGPERPDYAPARSCPTRATQTPTSKPAR